MAQWYGAGLEYVWKPRFPLHVTFPSGEVKQANLLEQSYPSSILGRGVMVINIVLGILGRIIPEKIKKYLRVCYYGNKYRKKFVMRLVKDHYEYLLPDKRIIKFYSSVSAELAEILEGYLINYYPKEGDVIIDGGAYVGLFAIYCSSLVGKKGKIYAFEPDKESYDKLLKNLRLNGIDNVISLRVGLWSKKGKLKFYLNGEGTSPLIKSTNREEILDVDTLDNLNLKKVDLIKADIEGSEIEALKGMKKTLRKCSPKLAIASYHILEGGMAFKKVEQFLKKLGYKTYTGYPRHLTTYGERS